MTTATIRHDRFLPHPPARVWRALTDPARMSLWLMKTDFLPVVGHRFTYDTGAFGLTQCEVLELVEPLLLRISWKNPPLDTTVTWRLVPEDAGTRLFLEHAGFDLSHPVQKMAFDGMSGGWAGRIPEALAWAVETVDRG